MNRICSLFGIEKPIIQAGMIWCSGWELAAAVSNAGGLGIIGAGAMYPDELRSNIQQCKAKTNKPFAVNIPLLYPDLEKHMAIIIEEKVPIVFTSAGSPKKWTPVLKQAGIIVVHVVASSKLALKCQEAGVDAVVAEGFEAGGHNGREETTTLCLIPAVRKTIHLPLIAAGGIGSGRAMLAAFVLGAEAVQIGTRFVCTHESIAHQNFKEKVRDLAEGDTQLAMKKVVPVRLVKNAFFEQINAAEERGATAPELLEILGRARAKKGMHEGDLENGELEIGQVSALITEILPAAQVVNEIWEEFREAREKVGELG